MNIVFTDTEQSLQRKYKRYSGKLAAAGSGVILFGIWSIVKVLLYYCIDLESDINLFYVVGIDDKTMDAITLLTLGTVEFILRYYVGRSARREALGKRKTSLYIVLACALFILSAGSTAYMIVDSFDVESIGYTFIGVIFEGTSSFVVAALIYYSIKMRQIAEIIKAE